MRKVYEINLSTALLTIHIEDFVNFASSLLIVFSVENIIRFRTGDLPVVSLLDVEDLVRLRAPYLGVISL